MGLDVNIGQEHLSIHATIQLASHVVAAQFIQLHKDLPLMVTSDIRIGGKSNLSVFDQGQLSVSFSVYSAKSDD